MKESGHLVSFLSVSATTLLSWQRSRWPQAPSPTLHTSDRKEQAHHISSSGIPFPSLPTPNTVKAYQSSNHSHTLMGQLSWLIIPRQYLLQIKSKEQKTHCLFAHSTRLLDSLSVSNTGSDDEPLAADSIFNPINKNSLGSREWKGNEPVPTPWNLVFKDLHKHLV